MEDAGSPSPPAPAECAVCGRPAKAALACPGCRCVAYCSRRHAEAHHRQLGHGAGAGSECARMAAALARRPELASHPFPWAAATHAEQPCAWLHRLALHSGAPTDSGGGGSAPSPNAWLRECPQHGGPAAAGPWGAAAPLLRSLWADGGAAGEAGVPALSREALLAALGPDWLGLPPSHAPCLLSSAPASAAAELSGWRGYYALRGLPLQSPAALLLDAVLTLHAAAARALRQLAAAAAAAGPERREQRAAALAQPLVLHLLGPRRELDAWPLLLELGCLLPPEQHLEVHLIGPEVPAWAHGRGLRVAAPAAPPCGRRGCSCGRQAADQPASGGAAGSERAGGTAGSQALFFWRGAWHEVAAEVEARHGAAHAVVAPNAGLAAFLEWVPTLQWLLGSIPAGSSSSAGGGAAGAVGPQLRPPLCCCFTDYNEEAVHRARQMAEHLLQAQPPGLGPAAPASGGVQAPAPPAGAGEGSGCGGGGGGACNSRGVELAWALHPWRQPAAVLAADHALPSASNGFALWLQPASA